MPSRRQFLKSASIASASLFVPTSVLAAGQDISMSYRQPEESSSHQATFMQWPVNPRVHSDRYFLSDLQQSIADVANAIAAFEPVIMLMSAEHKSKARRILSSTVEIWDVPTDDLWARDSGPCFVRNADGDLAVRQFNFNGWGNKQVHENDGLIAARIAQRLSLPLLDNGIVGEPGGIEFDGHGTLIAHESSWINKNRNAGSKSEISTLLKEAYGADKVVWAPGIAGADITDYHIDSLARFVDKGRILIQMPDDIYPNDPWSKAAYETYDILANATDANGQKFELIEIAEPTAPRIQSDDFVAAYANYYVCNGGLITAQFGDKQKDEAALNTLRRLYPDREVVALNVDTIGEVGGGIHCATQQWPAA